MDAQLPLAPKPRPGWNPRHLPDGARSAAALLLVFAKAGEACVPLTQRAAALTSHPGQVSLPGGSIDPGETIEQAALREAHEEIGLDGRLVEILGPLTPLYIPVSGFTLQPVVGLCEQTPPLRPTTDEVERIIEVTIDDLLDA
ncbi:MAG: CoA pyrophosphatase, partial [Acidobacteria bacterium]|nr:CoA pyrophosphatase [Acidobacteriota bacterium]